MIGDILLRTNLRYLSWSLRTRVSLALRQTATVRGEHGLNRRERRGGGERSLLSRSVISDSSEKVMAPLRRNWLCGLRGARLWWLLLAGRGKGGGAARAGLLRLPFPSVGLSGEPAGGRGPTSEGLARLPRTASGSARPREWKEMTRHFRYASVGQCCALSLRPCRPMPVRASGRTDRRPGKGRRGGKTVVVRKQLAQTELLFD